MAEFTIKQIFQDNWNDFLNNNSDIYIRPIVFDEVNKIFNCGNPDFGYALYVCDHWVNFLKFLLGVNPDFVILVVLNMLKIELYL